MSATVSAYALKAAADETYHSVTFPRDTKRKSTGYFFLNKIQSNPLTMRLRRSPRITPSVPRENHQFTCRSTAALQSWLTAPPSMAARATATSRAYAMAKTYKPGGVVILGSHRPAFRNQWFDFL